MSGCWCPIYIVLDSMHSPVYQFINWSPITSSISNASKFFITLHSTYKTSFGSGISLISFSEFFSFGTKYKIILTWFLILVLISRMRHCIYTITCHFVYTSFFITGEWHNNLINVLFSLPCLLSNLFFCSPGHLLLLTLWVPLFFSITVLSPKIA